MVVRLYLSDVVTGLFASLPSLGFVGLSRKDGRIDRAFEASMPLIRLVAEREGLDLSFDVSTHKVYGDSRSVDEELGKALSRRVAHVRVPHDEQMYYTSISEFDASHFIGSLPGSPSLYDEISREIVSQYRDL